jgi:phenylacetate-coenzyme A ligase PaaK-like adenylate-forming protein
VLRPALHYTRFAWGLRQLVRHPFPEDPEAVILDQLRNREARFVEHLRRVIAVRPQHPVNRLMIEAGCDAGDVENLVAREGLEAALEKLRQNGVWVSHEEFKGRKPLVRGGKEIPASPERFLNPFVRGAWSERTSGTTGKPVSVPVNLDHLILGEQWRSVAFRQYRMPDRPMIMLSPALPALLGFLRQVWAHKSGYAVQAWYVPGSDRQAAWHYRAATRALLGELRCLGVPVSSLIWLPRNDFSIVARAIAGLRGRCVVGGNTSRCVRVAAAAIESGLDIGGARFWTGGEGVTPGKAEVFRRAGAEVYPGYGARELGSLGHACPHYQGHNTVHHFSAATAIIAQRRPAPWAGGEVNSLMFTTLLPSAPFFAINLELGDHGVIEKARCGCRFSQLGFDTVISDIYSYTKLTGHGASLFGTDIVRILEQALPARFGGGPMDYQLLEQEAGTQTRFVLRVDPRIGDVPAAEIRKYFMEQVGKLFAGSFFVWMWNNTDAVGVVREAPIAGATGKILPLMVLGRGSSLRRETTRV